MSQSYSMGLVNIQLQATAISWMSCGFVSSATSELINSQVDAGSYVLSNVYSL